MECLLTDRIHRVNVESLRNLKAIYFGPEKEINLAWLFGLKQLKAIYLAGAYDISALFELKQRYGRADLQVYRLGCLLSGPDDPAIEFNRFEANFRYLGAYPSKMADKIPFCFDICYTHIEHLARQLQITIFSRLTDLAWLSLDRPVQDIDRFLDFLNTFNYMANLVVQSDQPQALLDRLPEYSGLQKLQLMRTPSDFEFLFRLKNLVDLCLTTGCRVDTKTIRSALEELEFLEVFYFEYPNAMFKIQISIKTPKRFEISVGKKRMLITCDLNVVIQFIKRKLTEQEQGDVQMEEHED